MVKLKVESLKFRGLCLWALLLFSPLTFAQREASDVRKGNREYKSENFSGAEVDYRRALQTNKDSYEAHYNLGDALYRQEKYADALEAYETAARSLDKKEDKTRYSKVMHNIGNCHFAAQQYDKAVSAYQESLRANPKDNETRYNLVKAMEMLQQQQQQQQQGGDTGGDGSDGSDAGNAGDAGNTPQIPTENTGGSISYSDADLKLMAAIIQAEAGGESYAGQLAVGTVIMNRVKSSLFPNTLSGVIYQTNQFQPVRDGHLALILERGPNESCTNAARQVLNGYRSGDWLFFMTKKWADYYGITGYTMIGNHAFFRNWGAN